MRKLTLAIFLLITAYNAVGQNTPVNVTAPGTATPLPVPADYATEIKGRFRRVYNLNKAVTNTTTVTPASPIEDASLITEYKDGLDRSFQVVNKQFSPLKNDIVNMSVYDDAGRQNTSYLPYAATTENYNDGNLKRNVYNRAAQFNGGMYSGEQIFYGKSFFDNSPLNTLTKVTAPGNSWTGAGKGVTYTERANTTADSVRKWSIGPGIDEIPVTTAMYSPGELLVKEVTDEEGNRKLEYVDLQKRVILTRQQAINSPGSGHKGWLCTYFVYDELNHLRVKIAPDAVEAVMSNWSLATTNVFSGFCFRYSYDEKGRLIRLEIPGANMKEIVYDVLDRPVFVRDGNQKKDGKWIVTFYDARNRPVMTALYPSTQTRDQLQISMNSATSAVVLTNNIPGIAELVIGNRETGKAAYKATSSIVFQDGFESETAAEFTAEIDPALISSTEAVTVTNPLPNITGYTPLSYTYYDDYSFPGAKSFDNSYNAQLQSVNNPAADPLVASNLTEGLVTGSKVRVLGTDQWLTSTMLYDKKGRSIQVRTDNIAGGEDVITNLYQFNGNLLSTYRHHKNPRSALSANVKLLSLHTFDHTGRVTAIKKRLNESTQLERTVMQNTYDELGRLKTRKLGIKPDGVSLEDQTYDYNVRGWLKGINRNYVNTANSTSSKFGMELSYDYGFNANKLNGNIAGIKWKGYNDRTARAYGYGYDRSNRLVRADFSQQNTGSTNWTKDKADFSVSNLNYDANGNILSMTQRGLKGTASPIIDSLSYGYLPQSNKLNYVTDKQNDSQSTLQDFKEVNNNTSQDYDYDDAGNLTKDLNKNVAGITYNHLNKPELLTITGKGSIRYVYDAAGNRLQKIIKENGQADKVYDYSGGFMYLNDSLLFVSHEAGRIRAIYESGKPIDYTFDYFVKDHLQNTRMVLTEQTNFTMYAATMETESAAAENALFSNVEESRTAKPVGYPQDNMTSKNAFVAKLNAKEGKKIGPSLVLRVMAGDTIQIGARAFFKSQGPHDKSHKTPVEDMIVSLTQAFGNGASSQSTHNLQEAAAASPFTGNFNSNDYQRLKEKDPEQNRQDNPKAYLNFVLFDDQFNLVEENSGVRQVKGEPDELQTLAVDKMPIKQSGFLYVYTSNETAQDVFFDNVTLGVAQGPVLEETHYYPFGVAMTGISYNAPLKLKNAERFNAGAEFIDEFELNQYNTFYRTYDPQTGRFQGADIAATDFPGLSPYQYGNNNPVYFNDPMGDITAEMLEQAISGLANSNYGGTWSESGGTSYYSSNADAFNDGANGMDAGSYWGSYGFADSYAAAANQYNTSQYAISNNSFVAPMRVYLPWGVTVVAYNKDSYTKAGQQIYDQAQAWYNKGVWGSVLNGIDNTEDVLSFSRDVTSGMLVGTQMLANRATGRAVTEGLVVNALDATRLGRVVGKAAPVIDIAMDVRKGDWGKAGIKTAWALVEGPIAATGPWGIGIVVVVNVSMGAADVFGWW